MVFYENGIVRSCLSVVWSERETSKINKGQDFRSATQEKQTQHPLCRSIEITSGCGAGFIRGNAISG
jgi:hypothetical protein